MEIGLKNNLISILSYILVKIDFSIHIANTKLIIIQTKYTRVWVDKRYINPNKSFKNCDN